MLFAGLRKDIKAIRERDPAARNALEALLFYPGLHALMNHRFAHLLYRCGLKFLARAVSNISRFFTGVEIHPGAKIGRGILIDHGAGVVIGETAEIGDGCTIYQGVTLGGTGKDTGKRHPTLGKGVMVGSGAKILGPFTIGDGAKIASNAVVLDFVPPYSTAVGVPARVTKLGVKKVGEQFDHIHVPDPISQELCKLEVELRRIKARMAKLEKALETNTFEPVDHDDEKESNNEAV